MGPVSTYGRAANSSSSDSWIAVWSARRRAHHVVVVVTAGVASHGAGGFASAVVEADDDGAVHARLGTRGVLPQGGAGGEVVHLAVVAGGEPCVEVRRRRGRAECGDPDQIEAEAVRERFDARGFGLRAVGHPWRTAQWA